jgi:hypothetical protein
MQEKHPDWSDRQLRCPLYWQGYLRKVMRDFVNSVQIKGAEPVWIPEAMGVNVTETCRAAGIELEWPPMTKTYIVVLFAKKCSWVDGLPKATDKPFRLEITDAEELKGT